MTKQRLFLLFLIPFLLLNTVFAVTYYNSQNIFEIRNVEILEEDGNYFAKVDIESYVGKLFLYSELIYKAENLVIDEENFICNDHCQITIPIEEVYFDEYRINIYTKYKNKHYIDKYNFELEYNPIFIPQVNVTLNQNIFLIENSLIKIGGTIISNQDSFEPVKYLLEIYPFSKPDYRQYYEKTCYGNCGFEFDLEGPYVVDQYQINLYSTLGETFTNFEIQINDSNEENNTNNQTDSNETIQEYYFESLPPNFIYSNVDSNEANSINNNLNNYNLTFDVSKQVKSLNQISNFDSVNVEIKFNDGNVKRVFIPDTKLAETSIGFEYVDKSKVELDSNIVNAFAINPQVSDNVKNYNLDFVATGNAIYKCSDYNFVNQICFGSFVKLMDTIPGKQYSLLLTPVDPIFVEIFEPTFEVQRGITSATGSTISQSINAINQSESFILFNIINTASTPDDWEFTPDFSSDSTIRFMRYDGLTLSTEVSWQVISSNLFNVQRGSYVLSVGTSSVNIPISNINLSESFVVIYGRCNSAQNTNNMAGFFRGSLTSSTNLYLERGNAAKCEATVSWQVVQFNGAQVQFGEVNFDSTTATLSDTILGVNRLNSFLIFSSSSVGTDPGMNSNLFRGEISTSNQITFTRAGAETNSNRDIFYYVIEHPYLSVQRGLNSFTNDITQTITQVSNISTTFITSSVANSGGGQTYNNFHYYLNFLTDSTLNFNKQTTSQTDFVNWEVIEFNPPTIDLTGQVTIGTLSGNNYNTEDLICKYDLGDDINSVLVNWYKDSSNILDLYLPFEGESSNYFKDFSDNNLLVSCTNCPIWQSSNGFDGNGDFLFDGNNDYLTLTNSNLDLSGGKFSISLWVNSQVTDTGYHGIFGFDPGTTSQRYPGMWIYNQNQIHFGFGTGSNWCSATTSSSVLNSGWNHLVLTFDGTDLNLYVNNVREMNFNGCAGTTPYPQTTVNIGRVDNYFTGSLDDVRIYKSVLSNGEIEKLFNNNINELSSDETDITQSWSCRVNGFNDLNVGPDYLSNSIIIMNDALPETNTSPNTCSAVFSFFCGNWPATSEGDNTFDTCPTSVGGAGDENVYEVYVNTTSAYSGDSVDITCAFDPYSTGTEEYIYYYNGTSWRQLYSGAGPNGNLHNVTVSVLLDAFEGDHWFRCIIDWDGENDECANVGSYYDNDDVKVTVYKKPEPFTINILAPENKTYVSSYIYSEFNINKLGSLAYSIDGSSYVSACTYCTTFNFSQIYRDGSHNLTIKAIEFGSTEPLFDSIIFSVDSNSSVEPRNTSMRTCSDTFSFFCGNWPATTEGDNTFDTCPSSAGNAGDENVIESYVNSSSVYFGDLVSVTCEFDPYSTGTEEYIYYYNGTGWKQLYSGAGPSGNIHNVSVTTIINSFEGTQWFRCIADWDGENDECANTGSYYDNDDVSIDVIDNTIPEIPFVLSILSPLNTTYFTSTISLDILTSVNANLSYSINGGSFVNLCFNCTSFTTNLEVSQRSNFIEVRAIHSGNGSKIYKNVTFSLDSSVDLEPAVINLNLKSSMGLNQTDEDLICDYSLNSLANSSVVNWLLDGSSISYLNLPFEGNLTNALIDFSGSNNNAVLFGNTIWNDSLGAFYFDGDNDYLNFGDLSQINGESSFTISIWFNRKTDVGTTTNHNVGNVLIAKSSQTATDILEIGTSGTNINLYVNNGGTDLFSYNAGIQNDRWYNLGLVFDSSKTNEIELYLDGVLIQSWATSSGNLISSTAPFSIGVARTDSANPTGDFNGFISDVKIFNYALSSDFMLNLANNESEILPSGETIVGNVWQCAVTPFSNEVKGNTLQSNILEVLEGSFRGVHLQLQKNITRINDNQFNVKLNLINLNDVATPKNQIIKIYGFILNNSILSNRVYSSSSWYNLVENNETISGGQILQWSIIENNLDDSALDKNTGFINSSNSALIEFNITATLNYSFDDLMRFGFDPVFE